MLPIMLETELEVWKEALIMYMASKVVYNGIEVTEKTGTVLEKYEENISLALELFEQGKDPGIYAKNATFYQNLFGFLAVHDACLLAIASTEGREHWRTYISAPRFDPYTMNNHQVLASAAAGNPEDSAAIIGALSWKEGMLADAFDSVNEAWRRITEAFGVSIDYGLSVRGAEFTAAAGRYLVNPDKSWEDVMENYEYFIAMEIFREEAEKLHNKTTQEESLKQQIALLGFEHNNLPPSGQAALDELRIISAELEETRIRHQNALIQYNNHAAAFLPQGIAMKRSTGKQSSSLIR
jgi:hypothetical protein